MDSNRLFDGLDQVRRALDFIDDQPVCAANKGRRIGSHGGERRAIVKRQERRASCKRPRQRCLPD